MANTTSVKSLYSKAVQVRVSSVLNRDTKQFGKQFLFDDDPETCWNSAEGAPQWVSLQFPSPVRVTGLNIQFQGGFAGRHCTLRSLAEDGAWSLIKEFYPQDINSLQHFPVAGDSPSTNYKVIFEKSTDFFGRVTIYKLDIIGTCLG